MQSEEKTAEILEAPVTTTTSVAKNNIAIKSKAASISSKTSNPKKPAVAKKAAPKKKPSPQKLVRPKRPFPTVTIEEAIVIPQKIKELNGGNPWRPSDVAQSMDRS